MIMNQTSISCYRRLRAEWWPWISTNTGLPILYILLSIYLILCCTGGLRRAILFFIFYPMYFIIIEDWGVTLLSRANRFLLMLFLNLFVNHYVIYSKCIMSNMFQFLTAYRSTTHHHPHTDIGAQYITHTHNLFTHVAHQYYCLVIPTTAAAYWDTLTLHGTQHMYNTVGRRCESFFI